MRLASLLLAAWLAASSVAVPARETPVDTAFLRQYALTRGFMLGRPVKPKPTPDGAAVLFLRSEARSPVQRLFEFDVATKQTRELLSPARLLGDGTEDLSPEEKARRERQRVSAGGFADYQLSDDGRLVLVALSDRLYVLERAKGKVRELKTSPGPLIDPKFSPDGGRVAYVRGFDVYVYDLATDLETRLTTGGTAEKTHGLAEFVAQEEMGRHSGYWWSPDSKFIAYTEADAAGVEVWHVADPMDPGKPPQPQYYPRPGKKNVAVRLGVIPVSGGKTIWVDWDRAKYEYLANVVWDKNGPLTLVVQTRAQGEIAFLRADAKNGRTEPLLIEVADTWVNLHAGAPRRLADGPSLLWIQDSKGFAPVVVRRNPSGAVMQISPDMDLAAQVVAIDEAAGLVYYQGVFGNEAGSRTIRTSLKLDAANAKNVPEILALDDNLGVTTVEASKNFETLVVTETSLSRLPRSIVTRNDITQALGELPSVAEEAPFTPRVELTNQGHTPDVFNSLRAEHRGYYCAIVRPRDFDPKRKYPVLVDVYGGPKHQHVVAAMRNWLLPQWLADQGFIVVAIDGRGTPHRGRNWERAIHRKFGSVPLDDQVAGLQALREKYPELDLSRVGIVGWSFGGYLSALAVLKRPDVFHAAVAGAPVSDWLDYDTHYTERYLGLPQDNPEAYREASLLTYADKLSRPLLIVHGTADDNVFFRHALKLSDALFRAGKPFELLPLPGLTHMVPDPVVTERLWGRIVGHFRTHLGGPR